ncbi:50S ribosomal protein L15e [Thermoplasmatales archaeon SW_10_69_26]|nr:MAG: 50S ribosomal protein L15e [Thermoplasmatales archaeon SW_10_69_26]
MARSSYSHMAERWNRPRDGEMREQTMKRLIQWRREPSIQRVERPTRLDRARSLGYKAKQGVCVARVRVRRGGLRKSRPDKGRGPSQMGVNRITPAKSLQRIGEERASKTFPNLRVLNSYEVLSDGRHYYYEVILVDPNHPAIETDDDLGWICDDEHKNRAERGLTSAGKKGRGLENKGKGAEKVRPSVRASDSKSK